MNRIDPTFKKLRDTRAGRIKRMIYDGYRISEIAELFMVKRAYVGSIKAGKIYTDIRPIPRDKPKKAIQKEVLVKEVDYVDYVDDVGRCYYCGKELWGYSIETSLGRFCNKDHHKKYNETKNRRDKLRGNPEQLQGKPKNITEMDPCPSSVLFCNGTSCLGESKAVLSVQTT
jgi:hypothetical protein